MTICMYKLRGQCLKDLFGGRPSDGVCKLKCTERKLPLWSSVDIERQLELEGYDPSNIEHRERGKCGC